MGTIHQKTLEDLEFPTVLGQVSDRCLTELGKKSVLAIRPMENRDEMVAELGRTSEFTASLTSDNKIPNPGFEAITLELRLLEIENTTLEIQGFRKIATMCRTVQELLGFLKKFQGYFPLLYKDSEQIQPNTDIPSAIGAVVDRFGEIRDDASERLAHLRKEIGQTRGKIDQSFASALHRLQESGYLDEIRESVVENRRVLAVKAMHRRKVQGTVMGRSKTGSIIYIEPAATLRLSRELNNLEFEEQEEIIRILHELTDRIRPFKALLADYQDYLTRADVTAAKAKYAHSMDALLPEINTVRRLYLREAYHPLLFAVNRQKGEKTWPQTIELHPEQRIIVISGPNAGGKSITLKTIGLLQVMLQSGLLIPVHERSSVDFFESILTDIGDNQSIENHLSTYSYRLKTMNTFLRSCDADTLFLIDEFGTGSDPELGGALAETFLEVFYERGSFGVITTHYANLKALADELPEAVNANMRFDGHTLEPTFQLVMGEAGSSFTFEVAQKNGIPFRLINRAKKKIDRGKVRFDATIAKLQKERNKMAQTGSALKEKESKAREEAERLEKLNAKIKDKLTSYQELYDHDQRMIHLGNKVEKAAERYFLDKKKRPLISELLRIVETENSKRRKSTVKEAKQERSKKAQVAQEVQHEVKALRVQKKADQKKAKAKKAGRPKPVLKVGDRVRLPDGRAVGTIDRLEKGKAVVNYGQFTTNVSVEQLELADRRG